MHCLMMHDCFMRPGPPNFFMSLQKWHSPHSVRTHASHFLQRVRLRRAPEALRLDGSLTPVDPGVESEADAGVAILGLGRLGGRCCRRERNEREREKEKETGVNKSLYICRTVMFCCVHKKQEMRESC